MTSWTEFCSQCGGLMWVQPGELAVQCSNCRNHIDYRCQQLQQLQQQLQQLEMELQYHKHQQLMAQRPRRLLEPLPSVFGKKRAVLCGLEYLGKRYSLKGCINDAKSMRSFLVQEMNFPFDSILMLTETDANPQRIPTKRNIIKAMRWLVEGNRAKDSLVFHFSGHGSQQKDEHGDEIDGLDEVLCPLDHETQGDIIDDEINKILVKPLIYGAKLHAIIDACNSGTVLDLPFVCRMKWNGSYKWEDQRLVRARKRRECGEAFCFSACDDDGTTGYTPAFLGESRGVMTHSFIEAVKTAGTAPTYGQLLLKCCQIQRTLSWQAGTYRRFDTSGEPLLTSSKEFDVHSTKFVL